MGQVKGRPPAQLLVVFLGPDGQFAGQETLIPARLYVLQISNSLLRQTPIILPNHLFYILRHRQATRQPRRIEATKRDEARSRTRVIADVKVGKWTTWW